VRCTALFTVSVVLLCCCVKEPVVQTIAIRLRLKYQQPVCLKCCLLSTIYVVGNRLIISLCSNLVDADVFSKSDPSKISCTRMIVQASLFLLFFWLRVVELCQPMPHSFRSFHAQQMIASRFCFVSVCVLFTQEYGTDNWKEVKHSVY